MIYTHFYTYPNYSFINATKYGGRTEDIITDIFKET
jgi:hypothetical protein